MASLARLDFGVVLQHRYVTVALAAAGAVALGAVVPFAGRVVDPALVVIAAVLALATALLVVLPAEARFRGLIVAMLVQDVLVLDVGFYILPSYLLTVALLPGLLVTRAPPMSASRPLKALLLVGAASVPFALLVQQRFSAAVPDAGARFSSPRPLVQFAALVLLVSAFFLTGRYVRSAAQYAKARTTLVIAATLVASLALYEQLAFYADFPGLDSLPGVREIPTSLFTAGGQAVFRSSATFLEPNHLGRFLVGVLMLSLGLMLTKKHPRWLWWAIVVQFLALIVSFSTAAYVAFSVGLVLFVVVGRRRLVLPVLGGVGLALGMGALLASTLNLRLSPVEVLQIRSEEAFLSETTAAGSPYEQARRVDYWRASADLVTDHPLFGVGIGNFGPAIAQAHPTLRADAGSYGLLWAWAGEFGLVGITLYFWLFGAVVRALWRAYRQTRAPELLGFLAGFAGMMVHYLSSGYNRMEIDMWVYLGLAMVAVRIAREKEATQSSASVASAMAARTAARV